MVRGGKKDGLPRINLSDEERKGVGGMSEIGKDTKRYNSQLQNQ